MTPFRSRIIRTIVSFLTLACGVFIIVMANTKWNDVKWLNPFGLLVIVISVLSIIYNILIIRKMRQFKKFSKVTDGEDPSLNVIKIYKDIELVDCRYPHELYVRHILELGIFALKRAKRYKTAEQFEFSFDNPRCITVTDIHGNEYELDLDLYIHHDNQRMTILLYENDSLEGEPGFDRQYVIDEVLDRSRRLLQDNMKE